MDTLHFVPPPAHCCEVFGSRVDVSGVCGADSSVGWFRGLCFFCSGARVYPVRWHSSLTRATAALKKKG